MPWWQSRVIEWDGKRRRGGNRRMREVALSKLVWDPSEGRTGALKEEIYIYIIQVTFMDNTQLICQCLWVTESNKENLTLIIVVQMRDLSLCLTSDTHTHKWINTSRNKHVNLQLANRWHIEQFSTVRVTFCVGGYQRSDVIYCGTPSHSFYFSSIVWVCPLCVLHKTFYGIKAPFT